MESQVQLLDQVTALLSETMGNQTGALFRKFYEFDDADGIMAGARSLLIEFVGPKMAEKKLKTIGDKR
jgi:hypothetical protein